MPRPARLLLSQSFYHVMTRGNNKNIVFKQHDDYEYYLDLLYKYKELLPFDLFHYCLMPTHVHMLIQTHHAEDFSLFMKKLNLAYFHYYRRAYGWVGHFWQDRFKSQTVGKDSYFIQCGKYIELNPVRARLAESPDSYTYSSFAHYSSGKVDPLITDDYVYKTCGKTDEERRMNYSSLVIGQDIYTTYKKRIWGTAKQRYNEVKKQQYHRSV